jgi:hypothetical protein
MALTLSQVWVDRLDSGSMGKTTYWTAGLAISVHARCTTWESCSQSAQMVPSLTLGNDRDEVVQFGQVHVLPRGK